MDLRPEQARTIAAAGYIFLFPLVANYRMMIAEVLDPSSPTFGGGIGHWVHRRHATSHESDVSVRHRTTLDSSVWLDLRDGPWTLTTADIGPDCSTRLTDLWGIVVHETEGVGGDPRPALIAADPWVGEVPPDTGPIVRAETAFVRCEARAQTSDPGDLEQVRRIQRAHRVEPVGERDAPTGAPAPPGPGWWPVGDHTLTSLEFWSVSTFALTLVTPDDQDRGIAQRLAEIGVVPGARWDASTLRPELRDAIEEGMDEALTELVRASADQHLLKSRRADFDRDYFGRAIAAVPLSNGAFGRFVD